MVKVLVIKNCKYCGHEPVWINLPMGAGIGCGFSANGPCGDNEVIASNMEDAVIKWNKLQEVD